MCHLSGDKQDKRTKNSCGQRLSISSVNSADLETTSQCITLNIGCPQLKNKKFTLLQHEYQSRQLLEMEVQIPYQKLKMNKS